MRNKDQLTASNVTNSEGALRLLGKLPDNYDSLDDAKKQLVREGRIRKLKELQKTVGLKRFKTDGGGWKYFKSQCERLFNEAALGEITL